MRAHCISLVYAVIAKAISCTRAEVFGDSAAREFCMCGKVSSGAGAK
jgi:hypothetical protein